MVAIRKASPASSGALDRPPRGNYGGLGEPLSPGKRNPTDLDQVAEVHRGG